jgi:hypothetical protein
LLYIVAFCGKAELIFGDPVPYAMRTSADYQFMEERGF